MKKQLIDPNAERRESVRIYRMTIDVYVEQNDLIAAAIKPLQNPDGSDDILALEEYTDFIINALGVFDTHDFVVLEERESPYSHSYYYALVKKDQYESASYKYILYVRLSDHMNRKESKHATRQYYNEKAQEQKQPKTKSKQVWRLKEITINKDTFNSYDEALDYIDKKLP